MREKNVGQISYNDDEGQLDMDLYHLYLKDKLQFLQDRALAHFERQHEQIQKPLKLMIEFIAEATVEAGMKLKVNPDNFQVRFTTEFKGTDDHVIQPGHEKTLLTAAWFNPDQYQSGFFFIELSPDRLREYAVQLFSSPFRRDEIVKQLINEVTHEIYHGHQYFHNKQELDSIPDPDVDYDGYVNSAGESNARAFGEDFSKKFWNKPDVKKRVGQL